MNIAFLIQPKENVVYIYENDTVRQAIEKCRYYYYMTYPVLNEKQEFVTIVSEGDLLFQFEGNDTLRDLGNKKVKDIVPRKPIFSIRIDSPFDEILDIISNQNIIPVVDDRNIFIGILSRKDLLEYLVEDRNRQYQQGVMDTFGEMVKAGLKKIALAHPFKTKKERSKYISFVSKMCKNYGIHYYLDNDPLITDLFEKHLNYGTYNIIFYRNKEDIDEYNYLKKYKYSKDYDEIRYEVAYRFGKLLSYSDETINRYIENNHEKE